MSDGRIFLGWTSTKQGLMGLAQGHNAVTPVRLEPAALGSRVKHSTTEPLRYTHTRTHTYIQTYMSHSPREVLCSYAPLLPKNNALISPNSWNKFLSSLKKFRLCSPNKIPKINSASPQIPQNRELHTRRLGSTRTMGFRGHAPRIVFFFFYKKRCNLVYTEYSKACNN